MTTDETPTQDETTTAAASAAAEGPEGTRRGERAVAFAKAAAKLMSDLHCEDVVVLDLRGLSQVTDAFVIASGTSNRQMKSVSDDIAELGEQYSQKMFRSHMDPDVTWAVLDFVNVVVHLFEPTARAYYDLEMLWGDAKRVSWRDEEPDG